MNKLRISISTDYILLMDSILEHKKLYHFKSKTLKKKHFSDRLGYFNDKAVEVCLFKHNVKHVKYKLDYIRLKEFLDLYTIIKSTKSFPLHIS